VGRLRYHKRQVRSKGWYCIGVHKGIFLNLKTDGGVSSQTKEGALVGFAIGVSGKEILKDRQVPGGDKILVYPGYEEGLLQRGGGSRYITPKTFESAQGVGHCPGRGGRAGD